MSDTRGPGQPRGPWYPYRKKSLKVNEANWQEIEEIATRRSELAGHRVAPTTIVNELIDAQLRRLKGTRRVPEEEGT